ncbi:Helitron helicase [Phytophthora megakarya]|uniref:Helitron helicase n=1 Tax=Phytophthora megakarya TaxID=4795 RepID=A0A225VP79_9STRA|nr:Helitron helicase [Phytophthora megakarya]
MGNVKTKDVLKTQKKIGRLTRTRRLCVRLGHALANHNDFNKSRVSGPDVEDDRHVLPPLEQCDKCRAWKWPVRSEWFRLEHLSEKDVREDRSVQGGRGIYTYRMQGKFAHYLGPSIPPIRQIYVVDEDMRKRAERRTGIFSGLDQEIPMTLDMMLVECNPYVGQFISQGEKIRKDIAVGKETVNLTLHLHADKRRP